MLNLCNKADNHSFTNYVQHSMSFMLLRVLFMCTCEAVEYTGAKAIPASVEPNFSFPAVVVSRSLSVEPCSVLLATSEVVLHC